MNQDNTKELLLRLQDKLDYNIDKFEANINEILRTQKEILQLCYLNDRHIDNEKSDFVVSVLIPIYNVELYLDECLESLYAQKLINAEFICINDGSTDASKKIVEKYISKDKRFKLIDKENSGYGASMNAGLDFAQGKYICILESDDIANKDMLEILYNTAEYYKADVVKGNYYTFESKLQNARLNDDMLKTIAFNRYLSEVERYKIATKTPSIWSGIYRREFLIKENIRFLESPGASYQDISFAFLTAVMARKYVMISYPVLYYRTGRDESSINNTGKIMCVCDEMNYIQDYINRYNLFNLQNTYEHNLFLKYRWNYERLEGKNKEIFGKIFEREIKRIDSQYAFTLEEWEDWELSWFKDYMKKGFSE